MGENTKIQWADDSINIWWGCHRHGTGCKNCYAESLASRFHPKWKLWGNDADSVRLYMPKWEADLRRLNAKAEKAGKPRVVFINSMSDFFEGFAGPLRVAGKNEETGERELHRTFYGPKKMRDGSVGCGVVKSGQVLGVGAGGEWRPISVYRPATIADLREEAFRVFDECPWLRFMLLTKRPDNVPDMWSRGALQPGFRRVEYWQATGGDAPRSSETMPRRENILIGTSISCQEDAGRNLPELLKCRELTPVLFASAEPLTGPMDLSSWLGPKRVYSRDADGVMHEQESNIDCVIIGGESGPNARPCDIAWVRSLVKQCRASGSLPFLKQLGSNVVTQIPAMQVAGATNGHGPHGRVPSRVGQVKFRDPKASDPSEWPEDLRDARQFPEISNAAI